ncbi:MAG TPA: MBL fold metallo-hydrolase [Bryobacteraceae bacterium]|jgi:glyoxylase-like metal-dependent hydrolase (beta-lactamase superfamily II)|nr:MBL fold metallo-hydrolase [Bryobacteraceae bacterium]
MDKVPLPDYAVAPLDNIAPHVTGLNIVFVNVYAISSPEGGWSLVDAGIPVSATFIKRFVEKRFGVESRPQNIIVTHGHFDHVGSLAELADHWNVPVYAHPDEFPYLTGRLSYPPPDTSVGGGLMTVLAPLYPRGPIDVSTHLEALPSDGSVPGLTAWKWIHTPGHTPGHVSFYRESDGTLLVGDAFCTTKPESFINAVATGKAELHGPPAYYTPDWDAARISIEKLAALRPAIVAPGHGYPMVGSEVADALEYMAVNFDRVVLPEKVRQARTASAAI